MQISTSHVLNIVAWCGASSLGGVAAASSLDTLDKLLYSRLPPDCVILASCGYWRLLLSRDERLLGVEVGCRYT